MTKIGSRIGTAAIVVALLGLLAATLWLAVHTWTSVGGPPLPTQGYVAMILGIVFSVVIGCGLMALVFYSNRYGYDERSNQDQHVRDQHISGDDDSATHRTQTHRTHEPAPR